MAYIPGFENDIFISYAHGDDRGWIDRLIDSLRPVLKRSLGIEPTFWIDKSDLHPYEDFRREIPSSIESSAVFLFFPSPSYIRSDYCVRQECPSFQRTLPAKRARFKGADLVNLQYALRCPLLPTDNNEHRQLFFGIDDIAFYDESGTLPHDSPGFQVKFRKLAGELKQLLTTMRNASTPVFLYPKRPGPALRRVHEELSVELTDHSYRLLPDSEMDFPGQLRKAELSVFLIDEAYDEELDQLTKVAKTFGNPWVVWCSPESLEGVPEQLGLIRNLDEYDSPTKTFLVATSSSNKVKELKEVVLDLLRPNAVAIPRSSEKPRIYLIYNSRNYKEKVNAGQIAYHYKGEFQFDHPDDPDQHTARLACSDGVLLVWGNTDEAWCAPEFETMTQVSRQARAKALCLFDPAEKKRDAADQIRSRAKDVLVLEQFGKFDPTRMEPFFNPIRRGPAVGAQ